MTATDPQTEREHAWARYPHDAAEILEGTEAPATHCRQPLCHAPIWWGLTAANRKRCPFDIKPDGTRTATSHWRTCRDRPGRKMTEPRFKPGDQVLVKGGRAHVWRIVRPDVVRDSIEPGYVLEDGMHMRTAGESVLTPWPETAADREAWLERHRDA